MGGKSPAPLRPRSDGVVNNHEKAQMLSCREKLLGREFEPVLKTDTGGLAEQAKVSGITLVKELCKLTP